MRLRHAQRIYASVGSSNCWTAAEMVALPAGCRTAALSLSELQQTPQTAPACELTPLLETQSACLTSHVNELAFAAGQTTGAGILSMTTCCHTGVSVHTTSTSLQLEADLCHIVEYDLHAAVARVLWHMHSHMAELPAVVNRAKAY